MARTDPADGAYRMRTSLLTALALLTLTACAEVEEFTEELFDTETPRERYEIRLDRAGLTGTALAVDWRAVAERALEEAPVVSTPYEEEGYFPPGDPDALGFRLPLRRGQLVRFNVTLHGDPDALLFMDVWQVVEDSVTTFRHVESADSGSTTIEFEPRRDGDYIVRAQPELLRGGRFTVSLELNPTLAFPVQGGGERDIGSVFGDPRDGGSRNHHGIDIFAARGTPALAAVEGTVYRVQNTEIGGRVVWLRDGRGNRLYYAHLDSQTVTNGQRVSVGDTVGFIGNTGNARTTPPHLHFGVYSRGPVDPYWFVHQPGGSVPRLTADTARLGEWARTAIADAVVRTSPDRRGAGIATLPEHTPVLVLAAYGDWYRVRLPDGVSGFVSARQAEPIAALDFAAPASAVAIRTRPTESADILDRTEPGDSLTVYGRFGDYLFVRRDSGREGWIAQMP